MCYFEEVMNFMNVFSHSTAYSLLSSLSQFSDSFHSVGHHGNCSSTALNPSQTKSSLTHLSSLPLLFLVDQLICYYDKFEYDDR